MPRKFLSLKQVMELIMQDSESESEDIAEICILPPTDGAESEMEAIDDNDLSPVEPPDVCGELEVFTGEDSDNVAPEDNSDCSDVEPEDRTGADCGRKIAKRKRVTPGRKLQPKRKGRYSYQ